MVQKRGKQQKKGVEQQLQMEEERRTMRKGRWGDPTQLVGCLWKLAAGLAAGRLLLALRYCVMDLEVVLWVGAL